MARRLGPTPSAPAQPRAPHQFVQARTKGLQLVAALQPLQITSIVKIDTPEGFLQMDAKLGMIRNTRKQWQLAMEPIMGPLARAIEASKVALSEAKKAAEGAKALDTEVSDQLDRMERHVKQLMADYKLEEQRRLREAREEEEREAQRVEEEARKKRLQAASARTPQVRARLEQQASELEQKAVERQMDVDAALVPVRGAASAARVQQKVRITDVLQFLQAVRDYEPTGGVYQVGVPPLMVTDKKGEPAPLVEIVAARLNDLFREQPGVVGSWPGVEVYDDITIAGR